MLASDTLVSYCSVRQRSSGSGYVPPMPSTTAATTAPGILSQADKVKPVCHAVALHRASCADSHHVCAHSFSFSVVPSPLNAAPMLLPHLLGQEQPPPVHCIRTVFCARRIFFDTATLRCMVHQIKAMIAKSKAQIAARMAGQGIAMPPQPPPTQMPQGPPRVKKHCAARLCMVQVGTAHRCFV